MKILDRNLSWIDFNIRVLSLSEDNNIPILERLKYLSIFANNFDEFFMVRIAKKHIRSNHIKNKEKNYFADLNSRVQLIYNRAVTSYLKIKALLKKEGLLILDKETDLTEVDKKKSKEIYSALIEPLITPILIDKSYPFPYISHLDTHIIVTIKEEDGQHYKHKHVLIKTPDNIANYYDIGEKGVKKYISTVNIILFNLGEIFPSSNIVNSTLFRVTRDMENTLDNSHDYSSRNILEHLEIVLLERKMGDVIRIQLLEKTKSKVCNLLQREMKIDDNFIFYSKGEVIDFGLAKRLYSASNLPALKYKSFTPSNLFFTKKVGNYDSIFDLLDQKDVMVHHPYDSFSSSTLQFLRDAIKDKDVVAIKQTIYRTDSNAILIDLLAEAASIGKQVVVVVEVHARFDENANLKWAKQLEQAGCHVIYGMQNLKVHCKVILIIRRKANKLFRYAQISTGNYNADTAKLYEDIGLFTTHTKLTEELDHLFKIISSGGCVEVIQFKHLLVSPFNMRKEIIKKINRAIPYAKDGKQPTIYIKLNSLTDEEIIEAIYQASEKGVIFNIVVRGASSIEANQNIRISSILGRFLEHSRIYIFDYLGNIECYTGSADIMYRNLNKRIEILTPIYDKEIQNRLIFLIKKMIDNNSNSWILKDRKWFLREGTYNIQDYLLTRRGIYQ